MLSQGKQQNDATGFGLLGLWVSDIYIIFFFFFFGFLGLLHIGFMVFDFFFFFCGFGCDCGLWLK